MRQSSSAFGPARPQPGDNEEIRRKAGDIATLARAVVHLANLGVRVMNISVTACINAAQPIDQAALGAAIRYAAVDKDIVIVAAAGNEGEGSACGQNPLFNPLRAEDPRDWQDVSTIVTPAWFSDYVLTVGAVSPDGQPLPQSIAGPWVGVAAPGLEVMGLSSVNGAPINALPGRDPGKAIPLSGTSFATAYTSGVAALVRAKYPQLSAHQIIRRITETAHNPPRGVDNKVGYGVVDPVAALTFDVPPGDRLPPEHLTKLLHVPDAAASPGSAAAAHRTDRRRDRGRAGRGRRRGCGGSAEAVMKARTIGINATIPAVVGVEVAVLAAIVIFPPARMSWWPTAAAAVVAIAAADAHGVPAQRRQMVLDRVRWRRRRRRADSPAAAVDIPHGASLYGVRVAGQIRR